MRTLVAILLFFCAFQSVYSVPWHIPPPSPTPYDQSLQFHPGPHARSPPHQLEQLSNIVIPTCALSCYLNALVVDGCAQEVDLRCHCSRGDVLLKTKSCVEAACDQQDQNEATQKVVDACRAVGINPQLPSATVNSTSRPTPSSTTPIQMAETTTPTTMNSTSSKRSSALSTSTTLSSEAATTSLAYSTNKTSTLPSPSETASTTPTPPAVPPIPPAPANSLSPSAKAGISVSTILVASTISIALTLYIRRLKRQLAQARAAAADVPDSVLRSPSRHSIIPDAMLASTRRPSWPTRPSSRVLSKREIPYTASRPVSPLSPVFARESGSWSGSGSGMRASLASVLGKQRGHVLSVVVERDDEDANSLVSRGNVTEPVPGQSEGLVDPLELDAGLTVQIFEAPVSITPRARSAEMERDALREFVFGEAQKRDVL